MSGSVVMNDEVKPCQLSSSGKTAGEELEEAYIEGNESGKTATELTQGIQNRNYPKVSGNKRSEYNGREHHKLCDRPSLTTSVKEAKPRALRIGRKEHPKDTPDKVETMRQRRWVNKEHVQ
jgi:hypothetical protein